MGGLQGGVWELSQVREGKATHIWRWEGATGGVRREGAGFKIFFFFVSQFFSTQSQHS